MKLINGYWVDRYNNKWNGDIYAKQQAEKYSDTLNHCRNCSDCRNCINCSYCVNCSDCINCSDCRNCINCSYCVNCSDCINCCDCRNCINCRNCSNCSDCRNCSNCSDCSYCRNCSNCSNCSDCSYCSYCSNCRNCRNCSNCSDCSNYAKNPCRYVTPKIGSRHDNTTIYWLGDNTQVVCGCFRGSIEKWEQAIRKTHRENEKYRNDYIHQVEIIKSIIEMSRGE